MLDKITAPNKPYTHSNIVGIIGSKRNGKSLLLAATIILKLIEGETVWSNMPVNTSDAILARKYSPSGNPIKYAESKPLDWDLFYRLDESFVEGTVAVDEVGYQASSRESGSVRNRLINACIRQAGHRNLDFIYTDRAFGRVDSRLREETDILIECNDLAFSPWGKQNRVEGGHCINLKYFDLSGQTTGKGIFDGKWYDPRRYYLERNFAGTPYLQCYDTKNITSIDEFCTRIQLNFKTRTIGNKDDYDEEKISTKEKILEAIASFKKTGKDIVPTRVFWNFLRDTFDVQGDPKILGRLVPPDVTRKATHNGFLYDFSGVEL